MNRLAVFVALWVVMPSTAQAQVAWDAPVLLSPHAPQGLSVFVVGSGPGDAVGVLGQWRQDRASLGLAYRAGIAQSDADDVSVHGGVDISGLLASSIEDADIQVAWWTGLGGGVGNEVVVSIPVGLVASWRGLGDGNVFAPYAGAHVSLDLASGEGDAVSLDGSLDMGLDLTLVSGWVVRFGASLLGRESVALGIRVPS